MILKINDFSISKNNTSLARLSKFEVSFSRQSKNYTSASGQTIIYGIRQYQEKISLSVECDSDSFKNLLNLLNSNFVFSVKYNRYEDELYDSDSAVKPDTVEKSMYISSDISFSQIYGGLYVISAEFTEV